MCVEQLLWTEGGKPCLGFNVVGDVVDGAPEWDFSDWPGGIIGQIRRQDADPQLTLWETHKHTQKHTRRHNRIETPESQVNLELFELSFSFDLHPH